MSLLTTFITGHLITALEEEFISHEPEMQAVLLSQVRLLSSELFDWAVSKIHPVAPAP